MSKQGRSRLAPPDTRPKNQALGTVEESSLPEQKDEPMLTELDIEIDCPRCKNIMELFSKFDYLSYYCNSCRLELNVN